jgi:hypothetical protein
VRISRYLCRAVAVVAKRKEEPVERLLGQGPFLADGPFCHLRDFGYVFPTKHESHGLVLDGVVKLLAISGSMPLSASYCAMAAGLSLTA